MNVFNEQEMNEICEKLKAEKREHEIQINYHKSSFFNKIKKTLEKDRRGEVVFCVLRPNHKVVAITCKEYPKDVFRIPTGGIGHREDILKAVRRETKEELGLDVEISEFAGVLKIDFQHKNRHLFFYSYLFILKEKGGRLLLDASDDEVSQVLELDLEGLRGVVEKLNHLQGKWEDWGKFRYATSKAILEYLENSKDFV